MTDTMQHTEQQHNSMLEPTGAVLDYERPVMDPESAYRALTNPRLVAARASVTELIVATGLPYELRYLFAAELARYETAIRESYVQVDDAAVGQLLKDRRNFDEAEVAAGMDEARRDLEQFTAKLARAAGVPNPLDPSAKGGLN